MLPPSFTLSDQLFGKIFPFHLVLDQQTQIVQFGELVPRLCPGISVGNQLKQHFRLNCPNIPIEFNALREQKFPFVQLETLHDGMPIEAEIVYVEQAEVMLLFGSPVFAPRENVLRDIATTVRYELKSPACFILGNLNHLNDYTEGLFKLLRLYEQHYPNPVPEIQAEAEAIDLDFLREDTPKLLHAVKMGADRILQIVLCLQERYRLSDQAKLKAVDIHSIIDNTLLMLGNRLKAKSEYPGIQVVKEYGNLPMVECYPGQLNQVFLNILNNALDALDSYNTQRHLSEIRDNPSTITIRTEVLNSDRIVVRIADNGPGMTAQVKAKIFGPFFTTKPVGRGTGMGLSLSHHIVVQQHRGSLECLSAPGQGAEFLIEIPVQQEEIID